MVQRADLWGQPNAALVLSGHHFFAPPVLTELRPRPGPSQWSRADRSGRREGWSGPSGTSAPSAGSGRGGKCVTAVPEVVEVECPEPDRGAGRLPDPAVEVAPAEWRPLGRGDTRLSGALPTWLSRWDLRSARTWGGIATVRRPASVLGGPNTRRPSCNSCSWRAMLTTRAERSMSARTNPASSAKRRLNVGNGPFVVTLETSPL